MPRVRRPAVIASVLAAAVGLVVTGCSGQQATFDGKWNRSDEVITDVTNAGFDCGFDVSNNLKQVITEHPVTKKPLDGSLILCQGFQVLLQDAPISYVLNLRKDCDAVTKDSLASPTMDRVIVVGENYVISGTGPDQGFPASATSADLAKAFNGKAETMMDFYAALCKGIPAVAATASPVAASGAAQSPSAS